MTVSYVFSSFFISDFSMESTPVQYILGYALYASILICLLLSYILDNFGPATVAVYLYHARLCTNFTVPIPFNDEAKRFLGMANMLGQTVVLFFNFYFILKINPRFRQLQILVNFLLITFLLLVKLLGLEGITRQSRLVVMGTIPTFIFWLMFTGLTNSINNHSEQLVVEAKREVEQVKMQQKLNSIYREIFQVLGEPILTIGQDDNVQVANS